MREVGDPADVRADDLHTGSKCLEHAHWAAFVRGGNEDIVQAPVEFRHLLVWDIERFSRPAFARVKEVDALYFAQFAEQALAFPSRVICSADHPDPELGQIAIQVDAWRYDFDTGNTGHPK